MEFSTIWRYRCWLFILPDIGTEIANIGKKLEKDCEAEEKENYFKTSG
jgi:hypothetical protein